MVYEKKLWLQLKTQGKYVQGMLVTLPSYHQLKLDHNSLFYVIINKMLNN